MQEENFYENFYEDLTATKESGKRRKILLIIFACTIVVVTVLTSTLIVELKKSDSREINSNATTKEQPTATKIEIVRRIKFSVDRARRTLLGTISGFRNNTEYRSTLKTKMGLDRNFKIYLSFTEVFRYSVIIK